MMGRYFYRFGLFVLLLSVLFLQVNVTPVSAKAPVLRFEQISLRDGLSQSSVYGILQDKKGFLWFGTEGGLNKYDGYEFTVYKHNPDDPTTLSSDLIWALTEDQDGQIWVGTSQGLDRFDRETGTFERFAHIEGDDRSLSGADVLALLQDSRGTLWVGTNNGGLNAYDPASKSFRHYRHDPSDPASIAGDSIESLFEDRQGMLWVGTDAGLDRFDPETGVFSHFPRKSRNPGNPNSQLVLSIYEDQAGYIWAGTNGEGLGKFDRQTETWVDYVHDVDNPDSLSNDIVWSIIEDRSGRLWVGTDGGGLDYFDREKGRFYHYRHDPANPESLSRDAVRSLFLDRSGVFWVGTYGGGLSRSNHNTVKFDLYRQEPGRDNTFSDSYFWSVVEDQDGILWLGTFQGGLNRYDRKTGTVSVYQHDPRDANTPSSNDIRSLLLDQQGYLWLGTGAAGLDRFDIRAGAFTHFHHDPDNANSLGSDQIRSLYQDRNGLLWIGTYANGMDRFDPKTGEFTHYRANPSDPSSLLADRVRAIYQDHSGALWVGTSGGGISILDQASGKFTNYAAEQGNPNALSNAIVFSFYEDTSGYMWVATFGGGLNRFDPHTATFTHYTEADGLPHNQVYSILADDKDDLWLSTNNGISRFDPHTETFRNYGIQDGLQNVEFNLGAAYRSKSGEMFFGGIDGLNAFFPDQVKDSSFLPPVVITAFQKFNQTIRTDLSSGEQIKLSYRDNYISFEFAALDYSAPDKNEYAYQLQGFDKDWVEAGNRRYASYTNLPGGNYVFRVKGTNADGVWNETGSSISITITPPFWETWWFMLFVFGSLIGGTAGVFGLRARNFRVQKERLEEQVAQRTTEIERRTKVAESLRDILVVLNSSRPLEDTLLFIAGQTEHLLACDAVAIYRLDPDNEMLVIQAANGLDFVDHEEVKIGLGEGVTGKAVQSREMVALPDTTELLNEMNNTGGEDDNRAGSSSILIAYRAMLSAPLVMQGVVYGALTLYYREARPFSEEEVDLASTVSEHIALALETARLREQEGQLAVTKERSRLARDLHDAVTQTLFSSSLLAEVLPRLWERNPEEAQRRLAELRQLNRGALAEMRSLLLELRPAALLEADMSELFQHLADAFTGRARIPVQLEMKVDPALGKALPADVKVSLYRITQEALNNIAKHAQAENVRVVVDCEAGQIKLIVQDDGRGFEMRELSGDHFGLGNMRERADNIRAELEIASNPGEGTTVSVTWKAQDLAPEAA